MQVNADRGDPVEPLHALHECGTHAGQPLRAEGERGEGRLEQDPLGLPLVHVVALHHALPAPHVLLVPGADPGGGVDVEVAPQRRVADSRAQQQLGCAEGSARR